MLSQTFAEPVDFDLGAYMASAPFFQPALRVRLRFGPEAAALALDNRAFWEGVEPQPDGAVVVTFAAPDMEAAAGSVLRIGLNAAIIEPQELRAFVREQARAIAAHFDKDDPVVGQSPAPQEHKEH